MLPNPLPPLVLSKPLLICQLSLNMSSILRLPVLVRYHECLLICDPRHLPPFWTCQHESKGPGHNTHWNIWWMDQFFFITTRPVILGDGRTSEPSRKLSELLIQNLTLDLLKQSLGWGLGMSIFSSSFRNPRGQPELRINAMDSKPFESSDAHVLRPQESE